MTDAPELAIRMKRATFNRALADADLAAIGPLLAPNVILITGTDSGLLSGRKAQLATWKREFIAGARIVYTRNAETVMISPIEPIAMEHGRWFGVAAPSGQTQASGSYAAKWRKFGQDWMIEAEIYVTLA